ncbi:MAG TPA: alpha/beta hydrolase [Gryllotalpicola sp.]
MLAELISIPTSANPLDGLLYEAPRATHAALLMHGNGMNFYYGASRFLPPRLAEVGISALAYNRHGHDTVSAATRTAEGSAYQTIAEASEDNERAAAFLADRGFAAPVVIGHSNGGMLAAHHASRHSETPALVLLSAHCGGREVLPRSAANGLFGRDRLAEYLEQAHELVDAGRGEELMLLPGWYYVTTAASLVDMESNVPVLTESATSISCPVLFIRGDTEDPELYPAEAFAAAAPGPVDVMVLDGCDHFYTGIEDEVGGIVADWLAERLG